MNLSDITNKAELIQAIDEYLTTPRAPKIRGDELNILLKKVLAYANDSCESIVVEASENGPYVLQWANTLKSKYGAFGHFEVWMESESGKLTIQEVPITMTTSVGGQAAETYSFELSGIKSIIIIK